MPDPGLRRQMDDRAQIRVPLDEGKDAGAVGDVEAGEGKAGRSGQPRQPRL